MVEAFTEEGAGMWAVEPSALHPKPLPELVAERPAATPIGRPPRRRHWRALASGVALLLAALPIGAIGFSWWDRTTIHAGGPVSVDSGTYGQRLAVGERTAFGGVMLRNGSERSAVLEKVRILGVTRGFEVLGLRTRPWPDNADAYTSTAEGFPARLTTPAAFTGDPLIPAAMTRTDGGRPEQRIQLLIAARASEPGVARARGVEIRYRVGHRRYRRVDDGAMYLCAPPEHFTFENCPGDEEDQFDNSVSDFPVFH